ncbi:hypothetical protein N7488_009639 [Penicillium malachiteum]|nr:hypothetical protein N7488_009639 [Penicillium malachiteum]
MSAICPSRLKPELRLAQAISAFTADLSADQKARLAEKRSEALKSPPSIQDVRSLTAEIDRANSGGRCVGPRLINLVGVVQKFASLGDVIVGGSQNIIACGVWCIVRLSLLVSRCRRIMAAHTLGKNMILTGIDDCGLSFVSRKDLDDLHERRSFRTPIRNLGYIIFTFPTVAIVRM